MPNARNQLNYSNDLFFKHALSREDEGSVYARNIIIERVAGIRVKENTVLNPNPDPGIIGEEHIILNIHVKDEQNRHPNVEMQTTYKSLVEVIRFEFYGARALNSQLKSGELYDQLKPAYQIIFIDEYAWDNKNLVSQYQMCSEQGEDGNYYPLILRIFIHMPAISDIVKRKEMQRLNDFKQLICLFENNKRNDILKSKERLMKIFVGRYEEMQKDDELWSTAVAIRMGEARYRNGLRDNFEEERAAGKMEGKLKGERQLLHRQVQIKFHEGYVMWLQTLTEEQIHIVSTLVLGYDAFESVKERISRSGTTI